MNIYRKSFAIIKWVVLFAVLLIALGLSACAPKLITVTFDTRGGSKLDDIRMLANVYARSVEECFPTKENFIFDGWYMDAELKQKFDTYRFEKDFTVYVKWVSMFEKNPDGTVILVRGYKKGYGKVVIPNSYEGGAVVEIADNAFDSSEITSIFLPNTLKAIGIQAFYRCSCLTTVEFEKGSVYESMKIPFEACPLIREVSLPSIKNITDRSGMLFRNCIGLTKVTAEDGVVLESSESSKYSPPDEFFAGCDNIEEIDLPLSAWNMRVNFDNTKWYQNQPDGLVYIGDIAFKYKGVAKGSVQLHPNTKAIAPFCFDGQREINALVLPEGLQYIGYRAFESVRQASNLSALPDSVE